MEKKFKKQATVSTDNSIIDEVDPYTAKVTFLLQKESISNIPDVSSVSSVLKERGTEDLKKLFVEGMEAFRGLENSSINGLLNEEFNIGGYYSSWTIDSLFNIFYEENEKNHSNFIVFTFAETGILINKLQEEITLGGEVRKIEPHIAIMSTFDNKDINFNKNFLICPLFSTDRMRDSDTLQTTNHDITGHWIMLLCDFTMCKAYLFDSLGANNDQVSKKAVLNFATNLFEGLNFYRPEPIFRDISLDHILSQGEFF